MPVGMLQIGPAQDARFAVGGLLRAQQVQDLGPVRQLAPPPRKAASASCPACSTDPARTRKQVSAPFGPP